MLYANDGKSPRQTIVSGMHTASDAVWFDLIDPTDAERATAERLTGLRVPSREDVAEIENSSRLYTEGKVMYLSMPYSYRGEDGRSHITPVGFVLSEHALVTLRYEALPAFETYSDWFAHAGALKSSETFVGLAEAIVDRLADVLEWVGAELDKLSKETFKTEDTSVRHHVRRADEALRRTLTKIGSFGDTLGNLRDSLLGIGRIAAYTQQVCTDAHSPGLSTRLATLRQDVASLNDYDNQLNGKVSFLLDAVLGFINIEQNNGVKVLTIASVVGIPPTFVVGLYGMNFKSMPEYDWAHGYAYGWAMILISIIIPLVWFRIRGWI